MYSTRVVEEQLLDFMSTMSTVMEGLDDFEKSNIVDLVMQTTTDHEPRFEVGYDAETGRRWIKAVPRKKRKWDRWG